ncbi:MAG: glycosyltransferase [Pirellulaceae bacterium]
MDRSLSLVLPIHNAQYSLVGRVRRLLEFLPELTSQFEILIVDDGSTDQTDEVAHELALQYPKIRVLNHPQRLGESVAAQTGVRLATGNIVFVQPENDPIRENELRQLMNVTAPTKNDTPIAVEQLQPRPFDSSLVQRLTQWGAELRRVHGGSKEIKPSPLKSTIDADGFTIPARRKRSFL